MVATPPTLTRQGTADILWAARKGLKRFGPDGADSLREGKGNAMATPDYMLLQIRNLEQQLELLRSMVISRGKRRKKSLEMRDLYGIWRKKGRFSEKEIDDATKSWIKPFPA